MDIPPLDVESMLACRHRLDALSKPLGSLGLLEEFAVRLAGMRGEVGGQLERRTVLVFAADNGIHAQGITSVPQEVTARQSELIASGGAGVGVLARQADAQVFIYDVGIAGPVHTSVANRRVMDGTRDMTQGPAMTPEEFFSAFDVGVQAVREHADAGIIGVGEMGICNTSAASAVGAALLGLPADEVVGPGAGIDAQELEKKKAAICRALAVNAPDPANPSEVAACVGSLDLAAMAGAFTQCARQRIPAVIDGCISACAALVAVRMEPEVRNYLFGSHQSTEPVFACILHALGLEAPLHLHMRLGEGSGTPLMFELLAASLAVVNDMATLEDAQINGEAFVDLRQQ